MAEVIASFRMALRHIWAFTFLHLIVRGLVLAFVAPLAGLILTFALKLSGTRALTDQDIAMFLLTPVGALAILGVAGVLFLAVVLDTAVMIVVTRQNTFGTWQNIRLGLQVALTRFGGLFRVGMLLFARVVLIIAPFAIIAGALALVTIRDYDINYYLTYWPPSFIGLIAAVAVLSVILAAVLVWRLSGWALALHLLLSEQRPPRKTFAASAKRLGGRKREVLFWILTWAIVRVALAMGVAAAAGLAIGYFQSRLLHDFRVLLIGTVGLLLLSSLANAIVSAVSNGALATLLDRVYQMSAPLGADRPTRFAPARAPRPLAIFVVAGLAVLLVAGSAFYTQRQLLAYQVNPRPVEIIAHRGSAALRPENTMAAIEQALVDRADWVEIDVQESADGEVIVAHDSDFMKLAGVDTKVWDVTMEELADIDIGSWFDPRFSDQRTPTLRDVLLAAQNRGRILIELKYYGHDVELEERVARIVEETGMVSDVMVMSLKVDGIRRMRSIRPDWPVGILAARAIGDLSRIDAEFLAVNTGQASLGLVRRANAAGKKVYVWTVDDPLTMARMVSMGVDGLITNDPALARRVVKDLASLTPAERLLLWVSDRLRLKSFDIVEEETDA